MANQLSRTDSSSNQDIRQRFNVKKTIIGVIVLLIGLFHLPEAILLIMDGISLDSILYLIGNILLCLLGIYQLKFRSREMRYLPTKSVVKEKNYSFNLKYLEPLKEMIESGNFSNNINIEKGTGGNLRLDVLMSWICNICGMTRSPLWRISWNTLNKGPFYFIHPHFYVIVR